MKQNADEKIATAVTPRLFNKQAAGQYLGGISEDMVERLINTGHISVVRLPASRSAYRDTARSTLIDRVELDELIERWREKKGA